VFDRLNACQALGTHPHDTRVETATPRETGSVYLPCRKAPRSIVRHLGIQAMSKREE
jgi:hypothetical protein